ncbi:hypothetical protein LP420_25515 [Massilia sp. B-10]|nr:hypothetical protein LP420_25515 [Massilia sp. B-10]UUZ52591.1 hypothetical protein LP419_24985 [Massilia sp. H-1]
MHAHDLVARGPHRRLRQEARCLGGGGRHGGDDRRHRARFTAAAAAASAEQRAGQQGDCGQLQRRAPGVGERVAVS